MWISDAWNWARVDVTCAQVIYEVLIMNNFNGTEDDLMGNTKSGGPSGVTDSVVMVTEYQT